MSVRGLWWDELTHPERYTVVRTERSQDKPQQWGVFLPEKLTALYPGLPNGIEYSTFDEAIERAHELVKIITTAKPELNKERS